jgi:hypothetical protein
MVANCLWLVAAVSHQPLKQLFNSASRFERSPPFLRLRRAWVCKATRNTWIKRGWQKGKGKKGIAGER